MVSDTRENKADKRFSEKYPKTNFGYLLDVIENNCQTSHPFQVSFLEIWHQK